MIKYFNSFSLFVMVGILFILSDCRGKKEKDDVRSKKIPALTIESEDVVFEYEDPDNGSNPFWYFGSAIIVRNNEDAFISRLESMKQYKLLNNVHWPLYKSGIKRFELKQADGRRSHKRTLSDRTFFPNFKFK